MQCTIDIQIPEHHFNNLIAESSFMQMLHETLSENREKIGYSIQDYHPTEKVRVVDFTDIYPAGEGIYKAMVRYTLEQFSVCSAIDSTDYASMELTIQYLNSMKLLRITGEYVPEI